MQDRSATREDAISLALDLRTHLPELARKQPDESLSGRTEWTRAVWNYFDKRYRERYGWTLYPKSEPIKGRVAGEFMADFSLFDNERGFRIACESEWGDLDRIDWAFDKLRAVKAEIKILIFQWPHGTSDTLPLEITNHIKPYLCQCGHHHVDHEFYLFLQFQKDKAKGFFWEPPELGPINPDQFQEPILLF